MQKDDKQEIQANLAQAEEQRKRKEQLLAKMREVDMQTLEESRSFPPHVSKLHNESPSIFSFTEAHEKTSTPVVGKRNSATKPQNSNVDFDLTFGSYAPSFGTPSPRSGLGPLGPGPTLTGPGHGGLDEEVKERKSLLMQQLFGSTAPLTELESTILSSSSTKPKSGALGGRKRDTETPVRQSSPGKLTLHSHSDLAFKAPKFFDEDIEELEL